MCLYQDNQLYWCGKAMEGAVNTLNNKLEGFEIRHPVTLYKRKQTSRRFEQRHSALTKGIVGRNVEKFVSLFPGAGCIKLFNRDLPIL